MSQEQESQKRRPVIDIPENYRTALSCGLSVAEEMITDLKMAVRGAAESAPDPRLSSMQGHIDTIHERLATIIDELNLQRQTHSMGSVVLSRCSKLWEILCDLKTSHLRGYGETPPPLHDYLDPRIDAMLKDVDQILAAAAAATKDNREQSGSGDIDQTAAGGDSLR